MANKTLTATAKWDDPKTVVNGDPDDQALDEDCHQRHANRAEWLKTQLDNHKAQTSGAHAATAVSATPTATSTSSTVQGQLLAISTSVENHKGQLSGAHPASAIGYTKPPSSTIITGSNLQDACTQLQAGVIAAQSNAQNKAKEYRDQVYGRICPESTFVNVPIINNIASNLEWMFELTHWVYRQKPGTMIYDGASELIFAIPTTSRYARIRNCTVMVKPTRGHTRLPEQLPKLQLYKCLQNDTDGMTPIQTASIQSTTLVEYESPHAGAHTLNVFFDVGSPFPENVYEMYFARFSPEDGAGALSELKVSGLKINYTLQPLPDL